MNATCSRHSDLQIPNLLPKIGTGSPSIVRHRSCLNWPLLRVVAAAEDITQPTDWQIKDDHHVVIVHLGGDMTDLHTELEGHFGSIGPATPGEIWTVPAGRDYASHARGGTIEFAVLYLPTQLQGTVDCSPIDIAHLAGTRNDFLYQSMRQLLSLANRTDDASQMEAESVAQSTTHHIFERYSHELRDPAMYRPSLTSYQARLLREYIWENLAEQVTLDSLASVVDMTQHHLLIAFRKVFNTTPAQYLITQRLRRAQWLLLYSQLDITTIALKTGFASHSHLTNTFNQRFGYPPTQFRWQYS